MVLKRSKGYQDIEGTSEPSSSLENASENASLGQDIEMASVSVVPDGKFCSTIRIIRTDSSHFRHIYGYTSRKCTGLWLVSSKTLFMDGFMLDGGQYGDDDSFHPLARVAL